MKKVYIGIDAHKATNSIALAFSWTEEPQFHGKCSADLERFITVIRKLQKKHGWAKEEMALEMGPII